MPVAIAVASSMSGRLSRLPRSRPRSSIAISAVESGVAGCMRSRAAWLALSAGVSTVGVSDDGSSSVGISTVPPPSRPLISWVVVKRHRACRRGRTRAPCSRRSPSASAEAAATLPRSRSSPSSPSGAESRSRSTRLSPPSSERSTPASCTAPANIGSSGASWRPMMTMRSQSPPAPSVLLEVARHGQELVGVARDEMNLGELQLEVVALRLLRAAPCARDPRPGRRGHRPCGSRLRRAGPPGRGRAPLRR